MPEERGPVLAERSVELRQRRCSQTVPVPLGEADPNQWRRLLSPGASKARLETVRAFIEDEGLHPFNGLLSGRRYGSGAWAWRSSASGRLSDRAAAPGLDAAQLVQRREELGLSFVGSFGT